MNRALAESIRWVAGNRCDYCRIPDRLDPMPFQIDHIIAQQHGGTTSIENLAWCCFRCNKRKGPNIAGLDPVSGTVTRLFHPRQDAWDEHFEWNTAWLRGRTAIGRATIAVLGINDADVVAVRESLLAEGL